MWSWFGEVNIVLPGNLCIDGVFARYGRGEYVVSSRFRRKYIVCSRYGRWNIVGSS